MVVKYGGCWAQVVQFVASVNHRIGTSQWKTLVSETNCVKLRQRRAVILKK